MCAKVIEEWGGEYIKYDTDNNTMSKIDFGPFDIDRLYEYDTVLTCAYGKYEGRKMIVPTRTLTLTTFTFRSLRSIDWTSMIDLVFMELSPCGKWMVTSDGFGVYLSERNVRHTPRSIRLLKTRHTGAVARWINAKEFYVYMYMRVYVFNVHNYGVSFSGMRFDAWDNAVAGDDWRRGDYIFANSRLSSIFDITTSDSLSYIGFKLEIKKGDVCARKKQRKVELNNVFTVDWNGTKRTNVSSDVALLVLEPYFCPNLLECVRLIRKPPTLLFSFFYIPLNR
jgi:hypothetical protein